MAANRPPTLAELRGYAIARSLFRPTTLAGAFRRMGYVQADPIRAPARAQDLILRHRVADYHEGDLERRYPKLPVEEDALHNYGFLDRGLQAMLHPRKFSRLSRVERSHSALIEPILAFVQARGITHPRDLDALHRGQSLTNYWGGNSSAATQALDLLHYRGDLRVERREAGIRLYAPARQLPGASTHDQTSGVIVAEASQASIAATVGVGEDTDPAERARRLLERVVGLYAPLPRPSVRQLASMLRYGAPHLATQLLHRELIPRTIEDGGLRAIRIGDVDWIVPSVERIRGDAPERAWLLAPFDPVVWDRRRFELFWGWRYRFEAYTPARRRVLGYYAMPLLWRDQVIGWGNVSVSDERLTARLGFVAERPCDATFKREIEAEVHRFATFMRAGKSPRIGFVQ